MPGKLFLLPNLLSTEETDPFLYMPKSVGDIVSHLQGLIAESEKEARRYLKRFSFPEGRSFRDVPITLLNEHTKPNEISDLLAPLIEGQTWGLISDAGLPCIADPGANLVFLARKEGIKIEALAGPSSIVLSLMLSGLSAQRFSFQGYLEKDPEKLKQEICFLEKESKLRGTTQVCIEAPYRSLSLLKTLLEVLNESTLLSISSCLSQAEEFTLTLPVHVWKKRSLPDLHKKETVFIFKAASC